MNQIKNLLFFCAGLLLCMTCVTKDKDNEDIPLLTAIFTVNKNPQKALKLLEKVSFPEFLDKDTYMRYVATLKQAQYMDDQDITADSLILDAQDYFVETQDYEMAARASFYTAAYWDEKKVIDKVLEYALLAYHYAQLAENHSFRAKCTYWLGISYYNQNMLDSSRVYYLQALELYKNEPNADIYKLDITNMIGQIYRIQQNTEQADLYFDSGLKAARELHNTKYEARFLRNIGIALREKKEYQQAKEYFDLALAIKPDTEDKMRIYLSYAKLYKATNQPDSTIYYLNLIENRMSEITYPYTRRAIYRELILYYEKECNIMEMKYYTKSAAIEDQIIKELQDKEKIQAANERFEYSKTIDRTKTRSNLKILIGYHYCTADSAVCTVYSSNRKI